MWSDNETDRDFLNFRCIADTAAEMIISANGQPLSMGVSGGWGVGKSSMLSLISTALRDRGSNQYLFVNFNAWLYQGYDDARAALLEIIARKLIEYGETNTTGLEKAKEFLKRVNWLRTTGLIAGSAVSIAAGLPPIGLFGAAWSALQGLAQGHIEKENIEAVFTETKTNLMKSEEKASPPHQIQDLRKQFEDTLNEMNVTLVVFIDDLDRCLPPTAIATLEAIRLFLFLPRTAFIIAADDSMIRKAVRAHFKDVELNDDLLTNYFDKLIQIPLRVPPLGTQEVRAYLMLLFVENSELDANTQEEIRKKVCEQLSESWKGHRVDLKFLLSILKDCPDKLKADLELADRLAPLMTTATKIAGNPRLIKRFLNTLFIRLAIANSQHVSVDESALAKMLLFERCGSSEAYTELVAAINNGEQGKPVFLNEWEKRASAGEDIDGLPTAWKTSFAKEWLALPPAFAEMDLRAVVYVSREHMPIITATDQLSSEAAELLEALLSLKSWPNITLTERLSSLPKRETAIIMNQLMVRARQESSWGTPSVLWACLTVIDADSEQASVFAHFLETISASRLKSDLVPLLGDKNWAQKALAKWWENPETPGPVKNAIQALLRGE